MELRHLRYFVAVAEQGTFLQAARHLRVAQPALSRQIRDLESELGVVLFHRRPRGAVLTSAGEAFLEEARSTLAGAARAIVAAQREGDGDSVLHFGHGSEMGVFATLVADLLAAFRVRHCDVELRVTNSRQTELLAAVRSREVDIAATFLMQWPERDFQAHRLLDGAINGVLLGATHPLATRASIRLPELRDFTFLSRSSEEWPENYRLLLAALRERSLVPPQRIDRSGGAPSAGTVELAAGETWSLANEAVAAPFLMTTDSIVFRPFVEPPIPAWLALIWLPGAPERVQRLVDLARALYPEAGLAGRSLGARNGHRVEWPTPAPESRASRIAVRSPSSKSS